MPGRSCKVYCPAPGPARITNAEFSSCVNPVSAQSALQIASSARVCNPPRIRFCVVIILSCPADFLSADFGNLEAGDAASWTKFMVAVYCERLLLLSFLEVVNPRVLRRDALCPEN